MRTIKDFFKDIFQSGYDRMNSPIVGTYIIYFLLYNWRGFLILILSDSNIEEKINLIDKTYCNTNALLIPAIIAFAYIILLPHIQLFFDFILEFSQKVTYNIAQKKIKRILTGRIEEASLERQIADSRAGTSEINRLKDEVDSLKAQNDELIKKSNIDIQLFNKQINELTQNYSTSQTLAENIKNELRRYRDEYEKLKSNPAYMLLPKNILEIINGFTDFEKDEFLQLSRRDFSGFKEHNKLVSKLSQLDLIRFNDSTAGKIVLTPIGTIVVKYLNDNESPF